MQHSGALRNILERPNEVGVGEAYLRNDFDIDGDVETVVSYAAELKDSVYSLTQKLAIANMVRRLPQSSTFYPSTRKKALTGERHSIARDRQAVTHHYDVPTPFYQLFLDRQMVYSCGYFVSADDDLDTAQRQKLDYLCRKLRLQAGERVLDIGCGWGSLLLYAAAHYGVNATGITLSQPQADWGNARIARSGWRHRARILVQDYREMKLASDYDAVVSVGMFEHVGEENLPCYFRTAFDCLRPGGRFLNHGISQGRPQEQRQGPSFSDTYVFPDGELVPISTALATAERAGFEIRDVESLREHYALTLRHWVRNLEANCCEAVRHTDEETYRVWRLFMAGGAHAFTAGTMNVHQSLLVRPDETGRSPLPLTRSDWYLPNECGVSH